MTTRRHRYLLLTKAPVPYRVICIGSEVTSGRVAPDTGPVVNPDPDGIGYVERMAQRLAPHYEFINAGLPNCTIKDFAVSPEGAPFENPHIHRGAYESIVEPNLEPTTGERVDIATIFFGFLDAAKLVHSGEGWFEPAPLSVLEFALSLDILIQRLHSDGVDKILILSPHRWEDPPGATAIVEDRLATYATAVRDYVAVFASRGVSCLNIYNLLEQTAYFRSDTQPSAWWWPTQTGHDRLAAVIGRHIRQGTHYQWARPGVGTPPLRELFDYPPQPEP